MTFILLIQCSSEVVKVHIQLSCSSCMWAEHRTIRVLFLRKIFKIITSLYMVGKCFQDCIGTLLYTQRLNLFQRGRGYLVFIDELLFQYFIKLLKWKVVLDFAKNFLLINIIIIVKVTLWASCIVGRRKMLNSIALLNNNIDGHNLLIQCKVSVLSKLKFYHVS